MFIRVHFPLPTVSFTARIPATLARTVHAEPKWRKREGSLLQLFQTPEGEAGCDQLDAMEESIQAAIEQMFWQVAKRDSLSFGVGRAARKASISPDWDLRLDAQMRECDGLIVFHAGKALETALLIIYAKVNNRIPGREFPGVSPAQMRQDRGTHSLEALYIKILQSVEARPELADQMEQEFESMFQTAYHEGVNDLIVDGELVRRFFLVEDAPFREARVGGLRHGAEVTMDHSNYSQLLFPPEEGQSDFAQLPCGNFLEFLAKADVAYYGQRNMRWAHYSARDHERGRTYVVVGARFFARLVQGLVKLAAEQWLWEEQFARRWHERRQVIVSDFVRDHLQQSFEGEPQLPDSKPVDAMMKLFRSMRSRRTDDYDSIHAKWRFDRVKQTDDES